MTTHPLTCVQPSPAIIAIFHLLPLDCFLSFLKAPIPPHDKGFFDTDYETSFSTTTNCALSVSGISTVKILWRLKKCIILLSLGEKWGCVLFLETILYRSPETLKNLCLLRATGRHGKKRKKKKKTKKKKHKNRTPTFYV